MFDVLISRPDAHKLQLNSMDANGNHIIGNIRFWIVPQLPDGIAYRVLDHNSMKLQEFFYLLK
jgi:hypothetical protein